MLKSIISFGFVESIAKGLNFLVLLILPLFLSVEEFGVVGIIISVEVLFSSVLLFGQDRVILRYYNFENDQKSFLFSVIITWSFVAFFIILLSLVSSYFLLRNGIWGLQFWPDIIIIIIIIPITSFRFIFNAIIRTTSNFKYFTIDKLVFQILKISLIILFALTTKSYSSYIYGVFAALIIVFILEIYFLLDCISPIYNNEKIKRNWSFGFPFVFHVIAGNLLVYFSRFVLEQYASLETVALYTFASSIGLSITFVFAAFIVFFEPQIYKWSKNIIESEKLMGIFSLSTFAINAIIIGILIMTLPIVIERYFDEQYLKVIPVLPMILASISLNSIYFQSSYRLTIYEKTKLIPISTGIAGISSVIINLVLINKYGMYGAALSIFFSYVILSITTFSFSILFTPVKLSSVIGKKVFTIAFILAFLSLFEQYVIFYLFGLLTLSIISIMTILMYLKIKTKNIL